MLKEFTYCGVKYNIIHNDIRIFSEAETFYELPMLEAIRKLNRKGMYIDVGANVGNHSIYFCTQCPATVTIAFEPDPESYSLLEENVNANGGIVIACMAACGSETKRVMVCESEYKGSNYTINSEHGKTQMVRIDDMFDDEVTPQESPVAVMKIDVEGDEVEVVKGSIGLITNHKPELFIEVWSKERLREIMSILPDGYELKERYNHAPTYHLSANKSIPVTYRE
jgi:FkbM family methyltransferase